MVKKSQKLLPFWLPSSCPAWQFQRVNSLFYLQVIPMPACIHCLYPVSSLTTHYGPNSFSLTPCRAPSNHSKCKQNSNLADPYVEQHLNTILLDLLLAKPQAFAHFLFNSNHSNSTTETETEKKKEHKGEGKSISQVQHRKGWKVEFKKISEILRRWLAFLLVQSC